MLRLVCGADDTVHVDTGRYRAAGRGAYLCRDVQCLEMAKRRQSLRRALRGTVPDAVYAAARCIISPDGATPSA